jgi:hypothetical protein
LRQRDYIALGMRINPAYLQNMKSRNEIVKEELRQKSLEVEPVRTFEYRPNSEADYKNVVIEQLRAQIQELQAAKQQEQPIQVREIESPFPEQNKRKFRGIE